MVRKIRRFILTAVLLFSTVSGLSAGGTESLEPGWFEIDVWAEGFQEALDVRQRSDFTRLRYFSQAP